MRRRTFIRLPFLAALLAVVATALPVAQNARPARGARVAVVAFHDSRLLTLCPVIGKDVIESHVWSDRMSAKAAVFYPPPIEGMQSITGNLGFARPARLHLPRPARPSTATAAATGTVTVPTDLDRLARDMNVEARAENEFRKLGTYTVVASPSEAEFVFLLESTYEARILGGATPAPRPAQANDRGKNSPERIFGDVDAELRKRDWSQMPSWPPQAELEGQPGLSLIGVLGGDRPSNNRASILAIAVPAAAYLRDQGNGAALAAAKTWEGFATQSGENEQGVLTLRMAEPESLVDRFHGRGPRSPGYLPICAATLGRIRATDDPIEPPLPGIPAAAPEPDPTSVRGSGPTRFRSNVTFVAVPVTAVDEAGRSVPEIPAPAFHLYEDGVEQKIDRIDPGASPADIAFLIDRSISMIISREPVRSAAESMAGVVRPVDRGMVVSFADRIQVLAELTTDRAELQSVISAMRGGDGTRLHDALTLVTLDRMNLSPGRKVIVLFSDGVDSRSRLTDAAGALAAVETSNITVYSIRYDTRETRPALPAPRQAIDRWIIAPESADARGRAYDNADQFLQRLATVTGGRTYFAPADADLRGIFAHISQEISSQYTLHYYPSNDKLDGTYREIKVTVDRPGVTLRARSGYRAGVLQVGR